MKINEIIRCKRRELGLTQEQAAHRLGVSASAFNKWERGASLPDIMLLPGLARLLGVDLNTLLDFSEELSDAQIAEFMNSVDETASSAGYAAAFERVEAKLREYPSCDRLLLSAAFYLDGALYLYGEADEGDYRAKLDAWYERLAESDDPDVRLQALGMVINHCRASGDLERAEALVNTLPKNIVDRTEQLALLYTAQGRADEALPLWQSRVLEGISEAVTAMQHLFEYALKDGREADAESIAATAEAVSSAAGLPEWMGLTVRLSLAEALGRSEEYAELLARVMRSLETPWDNASSPLYSTFSAAGIESLAGHLERMIEREAGNK